MDIDQVTLRPVAEDDLPLLDRFLREPELAQPFLWAGWTDLGKWRRRWAENGMLGDDYSMLMVVRGTERLGSVSWRKVFGWHTSYYWNIGVGMLPEFRGRGNGSRAQQLLVSYLFTHTEVVRIEAITESGNVAEQRALEKAGFTREGVLRSAFFRQGQWRDSVVYGVLRDEVPIEELG
jgi:RimJ/RimL family protein N-acetyltransferase